MAEKEIEKKSKTPKTAPKKKVKSVEVKTSKEETVVQEVKKESAKPETPIKSKGIKIKVKYLFTVAILVLVGLIAYMYRAQVIVATVNGKPITRWELMVEMEKQIGPQTLQTLITKSLIKQESSKLGIEITDQEVETELSLIRQNLQVQGTTLEEVLASQGLKIEDIFEEVRVQLKMQKIVADSAKVTDAEVAEFVERTKTDEETPEPTPEELVQIKDQLEQQKLYQQTQLWLQQVQTNATIDYLLFPSPEVPDLPANGL